MTATSDVFMLTGGAVLSLAALAVSGFLGAYVFGLTPRGPANRAVVVVMIAFVVWDLGEAVQRAFPSMSPEALFLWARVEWTAITLVPAALYHLAVTYPVRPRRFGRPWTLIAIYLPFVAWAYLVLGTDLIINRSSTDLLGPSARVAPTYVYFAPLFFVWMFSSVMLFVRSWWRVRKTPSRRLLGIFLLGLLLGTVPAAVTELFWPLLTAGGTRPRPRSPLTKVLVGFIPRPRAPGQYFQLPTGLEA